MRVDQTLRRKFFEFLPQLFTLLSREQEAHLFRKMNYLKYRALKIRDRTVPIGQFISSAISS